MKKIITLTLCLLLCMVTFGLAGCGKSKNETVNTSVATNGNGGMVVSRGEYVYFVNGYNSYSVINKKNLSQKFEVGGLYRAKINEQGGLDYSENGSVANAERISSHLVGFESTSLYVFGDHVYYATPITNVDKKGNLQTDRLEFRRVSITGGDTKELYTSSVEATKVKYEFYYAEGKVYLMVKEDAKLTRVVCTGKVESNVVANDITSLAMAKDTYDVFESDSYKNIFYTKSNDGKTEIYNYNVVSNREEYKKTTTYKTCELLDYKFGHLYFKASGNDYPNYTYFYRVDATKNAVTSIEGSSEQLTTNKDYTNLYLLESEVDGYIAQSSDKTYYLSYNAGNISDPIVAVDSKIEIMACKNSYMYYKDGNDIKRISYYDLKAQCNAETETLLTIEGLQTYAYDIDDNNLYVYATSGSNTYLYGIKISNVMEEDTYEAKLLGVYCAGDEPTEDKE